MNAQNGSVKAIWRYGMAVSGEPKSRTAKGMKNKFVRLHNAYNKSLDTLHVECHQTLNLLAATIAAPLYGHLGDRFGRRRMLLAALAVFTLASLACAVAPSLLLLICARAVQGLGGGGLMTLASLTVLEAMLARECRVRS